MNQESTFRAIQCWLHKLFIILGLQLVNLLNSKSVKAFQTLITFRLKLKHLGFKGEKSEIFLGRVYLVQSHYYNIYQN